MDTKQEPVEAFNLDQDIQSEAGRSLVRQDDPPMPRQCEPVVHSRRYATERRELLTEPFDRWIKEV